MSGGKQVLLAEPRSFCAGVRRAIAIIDLALERHGAPIYIRKENVHNHYVVREFQRRHLRFGTSEPEVPEGAVCVFSAYSVSPQVRQNADARGLDVIDATCPLAAKVHQEARRFARDGRTLLLVGHAGPRGGRGHLQARPRPDGHHRDGCRRRGTGPSPSRHRGMERRSAAALRLGRPYRDR